MNLLHWLLSFLLAAWPMMQGPMFPGPGTPASSGGGSAPVFVGSSITVSGACSAVLTCTQSGLSIPAGDLIICVGSDDSFTASQTILCTDSHSDTFTCGSYVEDTGAGRSAQMCFTVAGATVTSTTETRSVSMSGQMLNTTVWYSGPAGSPGDGNNTAANESQTTFVGGNVTTTNAKDVCGGYFYTGSAITQNGSWAIEASGLTGDLVWVDQTFSATGTYQAQATVSGGNYGPGITACFK